MNDKHYPAGSSKGGQFAPKNATDIANGAEQKVENNSTSVSYVPKTTSAGQKRVFFADLSKEDQERIIRSYNETHADLIQHINYLNETAQTWLINTDARNFQREQWIDAEFDSQLKLGPKKQEKKAVLILGLPGSGKSTIAIPAAKENGAFIIDADNFKQRIPEFQNDNAMVSACHWESCDLADKFQDNLMKDGYNIVLGKVGSSYEDGNSGIKQCLDKLAENNYSVEVVLVDVPLEVAIDRTIGRFDRGETTRLVPFTPLVHADKNVFNTFDQALKHPVVKNGKLYSNDVNKGEQPILLHEFNKNQNE